MKLMGLLRLMPTALVALLALLAFVFGSHAGLDALVHEFEGECIHLDASTDICLVPAVLAE